ncbi:MFS transporter [Collimonas pratensis]|uniref:Major Facilitator Superfamily protein n=1 Tax=Collimonas pratensis TaxID=279113 RepID=A0A127QCH7_9BURK|nr:MFS transporter [Collimonas pratensis]AMP07686.1 major Facilitator Superfamily protein [Collimonas pratensis]
MNRNAAGKIWLYIAADTFAGVGFRVFQVFCTWLFIQNLKREDQLSNLLIAIWLTTTFLLPVAGVFAERFKKTRILFISCLLGTLSTILLVSLMPSFAEPEQSVKFVPVLVVAGVLLSGFQAAIFPLGAALIPNIVSNESDIQQAYKIKSSMFIVNLIFGPTLGGLVIGIYGGEASLVLAMTAYFLATVCAMTFLRGFNKEYAAVHSGKGYSSLLTDLGNGFMRIIRIAEERVIAMASLLTNMLLTPFIFVILPAKILGHGMTMLDVAMVELALGVGVLFSTTFLISRLQKRWEHHAIASFSTAILSITIVGFGCTNNLYVMFFLAFFLGGSLSIFNVTINAKRAISIPDGYRATMESSLLFLCTVSIPLGLFLTKFLFRHFDPDTTILWSAILVIPPVFLIFCSRPLRNMLNAERDAVPYYVRRYGALFSRGQ